MFTYHYHVCIDTSHLSVMWFYMDSVWTLGEINVMTTRWILFFFCGKKRKTSLLHTFATQQCLLHLYSLVRFFVHSHSQAHRHIGLDFLRQVTGAVHLLCTSSVPHQQAVSRAFCSFCALCCLAQHATLTSPSPSPPVQVAKREERRREWV